MEVDEAKHNGHLTKGEQKRLNQSEIAIAITFTVRSTDACLKKCMHEKGHRKGGLFNE
ncbi:MULTISPECIES: hypothetical protein [unclassified Luteibacter]|uniref:hypothetical protein n=1 Tax=unclassified Luteibacter TaxID=2620188 RepID=UPI00163AC3EC|nr:MULTISPECIES: hypothetical protein [unclassified Luteibacter]